MHCNRQQKYHGVSLNSRLCCLIPPDTPHNTHPPTHQTACQRVVTAVSEEASNGRSLSESRVRYLVDVFCSGGGTAALVACLQRWYGALDGAPTGHLQALVQAVCGVIVLVVDSVHPASSLGGGSPGLRGTAATSPPATAPVSGTYPSASATATLPDLMSLLQALVLTLEDVSTQGGPFAHGPLGELQVGVP